MTLIIKLFLILRVFSAFLSRSWHVPDEIWQSTEIAHELTFGYGYRTWEWREGARIRSFLHPLLFLPWFTFLRFFFPGSHYLYILGPRVLQGFVTWIGDVYLLRAARVLYSADGKSEWGFLFLYFFNWFYNYCGSRPLINSLEAAISNVALYLFFKGKTSALVPLLSVGFIMRPTLSLFWGPMALFYICRMNRLGILPAELRKAFFSGCVTVFCAIGIDSYFYGELTFAPWNFFRFNALTGGGSFYGTHPFHWYLSNALLVVLNLAIIPFIMYFFQKRKSENEIALFVSAALSLTAYSFVDHKEYRFILPLVPIFVLLGGRGVARRHGVSKIFTYSYAIFNLLTLLYLSAIHQSGTTTVVYPYLATEEPPPINSTVLFLMPCHSTPHQSYLRRPDVNMRFLHCEPGSDIDEADAFYSNPEVWLKHNLTGDVSTIVCFDVLAHLLNLNLEGRGYRVRKKIFHSHFPDGRVGSEIHVYRS